MIWSRRLLAACAMVLGVSRACAGRFDVYAISANVPTTITLPVAAGADAAVRAFLKPVGGTWQLCRVEQAGGRITFGVNPGAGVGSDFLLLLNPPPGMDINDQVPPQCLEFRIDTETQPSAPQVDAGRRRRSPGALQWCLSDAGNAVDPGSVTVRVDGSPLAAASVHIEAADGKNVRVVANLPRLDYGKHTVALAAADTAPDANRVSMRVVFEVFDATNYVRAEPGLAQVRVDSSYPDYPSIEPLTDGVRDLPGSGAGNDVTWASAENDQPHWIEVHLKEKRALKEVTVYWARDTVISRRIEVQVQENGEWRAQAATAADAAALRRCQTLRFAPIDTDRFRVYQPSNSGPESRPGLMWVLEVEAR